MTITKDMDEKYRNELCVIFPKKSCFLNDVFKEIFNLRGVRLMVLNRKIIIDEMEDFIIIYTPEVKDGIVETVLKGIGIDVSVDNNRTI